MRHSFLAAATGVFLLSTTAFAQDGHDHGAPPPPAARLPGGKPFAPRPPSSAKADPHGAPGKPATPGHAAPGGHDKPGHDDHHGPGHINWAVGFIGEKEGVTAETASFLWRPKGMPAPFGAQLVNFGVFAYLIVRFGKKPLVDGLQKRRDDLMREMDEAAKIRDEAEDRLASYEEKLETLDEEKARVESDYAEQGRKDEARIISEAKERRARMKKDAELTIAQEGRELEALLLSQTIARATLQAEELVKRKLGAQDHDRLADEFLADLGKTQNLGAST